MAQTTLHGFVSLVWRQFADSARHVQSVADTVLRRKALGLEAAMAQRDALLSGRYPHLEPQLSKLAVLRARVARKQMDGPAERETPAQHHTTLREWTTRLEGLEREIALQIPELRIEERLSAVDRQAVALALPAGATLVEFLRLNAFDFAKGPRGAERWQPRYIAFVLPAAGADGVRMVDLGPAEPIDAMVRTFRQTVGRQSSPSNSFWQACERLCTDVFYKVAPSPEEGGSSKRRLFLAPDGELNLLPFEALPEGPRYLIDQYEISYLGTGRDLVRLQATSEEPSAEAVVIADPAFDLGAAEENPTGAASHRGLRGEMAKEGVAFPRLPGTRLEGERIGNRLRVQPWLGAQALDPRLKQLKSPWLLHVATHGYSLSDRQSVEAELDPRRGMEGPGLDRLTASAGPNPMRRSGLALAGSENWRRGELAPEEIEDGLLMAEEVAQMDLRGTEMVVLSACEAGMDDLLHGEGVFGLRRGFLLAGARSLVMSLWKVDDLATVLLMDRFYENLLEGGQSRSEALREAQRYLRRDVTVGKIRVTWLKDAMIERLAAGNQEVREQMQQWKNSPDERRPFGSSYYWAPFILHGDTAPLRNRTA
jgi:CHAT domain-containing protein